MKQLTLLLILLGIISESLDARQQQIKSEIRHVTVFSEGAQVNRISSLELKAGFMEVVIGDLPINMDQSTIFVKPGAAKVRSIQFKVNKHDRASDLPVTQEIDAENRAAIDLLEKENSLLNVKLEVIKQELEFIQSNRNVSGSLKDYVAIKSMNEYYRVRLDSLLNSQWNINEQKLANSTQIDFIKKLVNKQSRLNIYPSQSIKAPTGELWLTLESDNAHREQLEISYYTKQASWIPTYDFRIENVNSPLEATCIANVVQQTGEDWENVEVTVSTANPKVSTRAPDMRLWRIDGLSKPPFASDTREKQKIIRAEGMVTGRVVDESGEGVPGVNVVVIGKQLGDITDIDGEFSINIPRGQ